MTDTAHGVESIPANNQKRWRDVFHKDEVIQRIRPAESFAYLPNPHRGTTTFQRFNGDELYPGLHWDDSKGPEVFKPFDGKLANPNYPDTTLSYCRWLWSVLEGQRHGVDGQYHCLKLECDAGQIGSWQGPELIDIPRYQFAQRNEPRLRRPR